ncbi:hypothetical protein KJY77_06000 [Canibacter sp. lx-72]|uniref:hypothetical protein n=1 Tax=Canibacter zhuwentaonis TaxID=2837491 RepID=UPI001BDDAFEB|nr:hypothetical protein [Canibacter zhuwentaonis]MBT1018680.1 hypothetical protein [Canibacter zhuwentaonis]MBT1035900.1 hypothetical protein [Canibacter zhuwentaonis]
MSAAKSVTVLEPKQWQARAASHQARADAFTRAHLARRARGIKHPIEDFLFTYYSYKPAQLKRWHAGANTVLPGDTERISWKYYRECALPPAVVGSAVDLQRFYALRRQAV